MGRPRRARALATRAAPSWGGGPDGLRLFTDAEGRHWTVTEERFPLAEWSSSDRGSHRAGHAVGWLHFARAHMRKRLRLFTARWRTIPDAELDRLCRRAREFCPAE